VSLRIVHVAKVAGISGAENHLLLLLPALRERGHDVRLVMLHEGEPGAAELADRLEAGGVAVERGPLVFSLRMDEQWTELTSGMKRPAPAPAKDWEVRSKSAWNYGLLASPADVSRMRVVNKPVGDFPFSPLGAPVEIREVVVPDPGPREARVRVQACGVCHTDLHYREGAINDDFPFLLGHEAAGTVESVGPEVDDLSPGDFVILNWRAVCGSCRACRRGRPWYCFATHNATQKMTLTDGTALTPALGIGAFAEQTLVAAGQATKVDARARRD